VKREDIVAIWSSRSLIRRLSSREEIGRVVEVWEGGEASVLAVDAGVDGTNDVPGLGRKPPEASWAIAVERIARP